MNWHVFDALVIVLIVLAALLFVLSVACVLVFLRVFLSLKREEHHRH